MNQTYLDLIREGGFIIVLLAICSVVSLAIILERLSVLRKKKFVNLSIYNKLRDAVRERDGTNIELVMQQNTYFL